MKRTNRLLSLLLAFMMVLTLVPTTVFAENTAGTAENPVKVTTFQELRDAMKDENVDYVEIAQDIDYEIKYLDYDSYCNLTDEEKREIDVTDGYRLDVFGKYGNVAINVEGTKHLVLSHDMNFTCRRIPNVTSTRGRYGLEALFYISGMSHLYVDGTGSITCSTNNWVGSHWAGMFLLSLSSSTAKLTINNGNFLLEPSLNLSRGSIVASLIDGEVEINGGTFRTKTNSPSKDGNGQTVYSDAWYTTEDNVIIDSLPHEILRINEATKLTINGGVFGPTDDCLMRTPVLSLALRDSDLDSENLIIEATRNFEINGGVFETGIICNTNSRFSSPKYIPDNVWSKLLGDGCSVAKTSTYRTGYVFNDSAMGEIEIQKAVVTKKNSLVLDYGGKISQNGGYARAEIGSFLYDVTTEVEAGSAVTIKPVPLKNYVFDHWELSSNITLTEGSTTSETIKFTMPNADATVKPVFKKITYSITYKLNEGSWDGAKGIGEYEVGSEVTLPTNVTKSGYDFLGWYEVENGLWYGPYDKITAYDSGNKTFTAKWKISADAEFPIKVRIDNVAGRTDKGATVALDKAAAARGETVTVQVNVKDGYTLNSVSFNKRGGRGEVDLNDLGNGKYTFTMPSDFTSNRDCVEITVKTTKNTYNINWNLNGGEKTGSSWGDEIYYRSTYTVTDYGFDMPKAEDVKKEGYKLVGWYTNSACTGDPVLRHEQGETGDKNYYAKWEKASYAVEAGRQVSGYVSVDKTAAQMGDTVTVTAIPNSGYKLSGGTLRYTYTDPNTYATKSEVITGNTFTMPGADVKITASFDIDPDYDFDITVTGGTASFNGSTITKAKQGTVVKLNTTVPEGKTFKEWEVVIGNTTVTNTTSATDASFTMPFGRVEINAVFEDAAPALTPITNVAATVTAPAIGAHPDFSATAVTTPDGGVNIVRVGVWAKMAKDDYLAGSDDWIYLTATDVFEAGYYYGVTLSAEANDGYSFTASTTGTVNGNALFHKRVVEGYFILDYIFEPLTASEYDIIVTKGKASVGTGSEISKAATGTVVTITADPAEAGKQFDKWEVIYGGVTIADVNSATTTFTMGGENVKVRATYKDAEPSHTHTYGTEWKSDDTNHWKECTDTACPNPTGSVKDKAAHTASDWIIDTAATATADGAKHKECTVCHKVLETATIPATGSGHTHAYSETWKSDADNHWHECECGDKADIAAHFFAWKIDREATKTETGLKHEECSVCGAKRNENTVIDKLPDGGNTNPGGNTGNDGNNTDKPSKDDSTKSPQTGDTASIGLWIALLFVSGGIVFGAGLYGKKRKESEAE